MSSEKAALVSPPKGGPKRGIAPTSFADALKRGSVFLPFKEASNFELFLLCISFLFAAAAGSMLPYFMRSFGSTINNLHTTMDVSGTVKEMAIAGGVTLVLQAIACMCMEICADRVTARMRCRYVDSVLSQSMSWYDTNDAASLSARLDVCLASVRDGIGMKLVAIPSNVVLIIGSIVIAFMSCWSITLCSLVGLLPAAFSGAVLGWAMRTTSTKVNKALEEAGSVATETFSSMRTVVAFGGENVAIERYTHHNREAEKAGIWGGFLSGLGIGGLISSVFAMFALVFYLSGGKVARGMEDIIASLPPGGEAIFQQPPSMWPRPEFEGGSAFVISVCLLMASFTLGNIAENISLLMKAVKSAETIYEVIEEPSAIDPTDPTGDKDVALDGDIVFDSVTFSYPSRPGAVILKNFSLRIPAGKSVAFVGPSGCGKSTILQLTQRIYDPVEGKISIAGRDLTSLNTRWYRSRLGVVMQEPRLFSTTIEENIRLGCPEAKTLADLEVVAQQAHVSAFVDQLPLRYQTMCGTGGAQLSGGQKQRVALARALLRQPAVLILDEATSALDNKSEKAVQKALDGVISTSSATTLIVAHRLTTIQKVDEIIVLDNRGDGAEVVQRGTHDELLKDTQGLYYNLFQSQDGSKGLQEQAPVKHPSMSHSAEGATTAVGFPSCEHQETEDDDLLLPATPVDGGVSALELMESSVGLNATSFLARLTDKGLTPPPKGRARLRRAVRMLAPEWFMFTVMIISSALSGASFPLMGLLLGNFLTVLFKPDPAELRDETDFWALIILIYFIVRFPIEALKQYCKEYLGARLSYRLRERAFTNIVHQDIAFFDDTKNNTGILCSILSADVASVTTAATGNFVSAFHGFFSFAVGIAIGFWYSWRLALVLLATFILSAGAVAVDHALNRPALNAAGGSSKKKKEDSASATFAEAVSGIRVVMSFGLEGHFSHLYEQAATSELGKKACTAFGFGISWGISQSMQFFVFSLALWYGTKLANEGEISTSAVLNTVFPIVFAATGLGVASTYSADAKNAQKALVDVFRVIDRPSRIDVRDALDGSGDMLENFTGSVEYKDVSFCYPNRPEQPVYKNLTFSIQPGESVALVGASGCGKSTAVQLLLRYYDLDDSTRVQADRAKTKEAHRVGRILVDSTNLKDANLIRLRSLIGLVSQEPVLFNLSIGDCIRYSKPNATQEEVEEAARMANAHGFISALPQGYNTNVGTAGAQLSGGQRQRIAIARALLRNPKILILDEATSALDAESEKQVQATLDKLVAEDAKRSTIIIAHRLSTVRTADKIMVLQNENAEGSQVVEMGNHEQLMNIPNGIYRGLVLSATEEG
ncbi:ATP-binding sub-family b (mdr tap) related protein [Cyclospora cayetanensis]|uniref:ATP-binding sub-family b (Mdr tap) related protein n=1 Tax=Cyclospora cayetanensis TaxID=88456 RepID=A0A1D3DAH0_9EIME|nr:ATP-binding sub-family b (mdr tap) related protein [Cyclospora cayetanensis]